MAYTNIDDPSAYFQTELYTGNSSTNAITFSGNSDMQPDLVWNKRRDAAYSHRLWDSSRGVTKYLASDSDVGEGTFGYVSSFNTDGITFGNNDQSVNVSGGSYVLWNWKANAGSTSSNTDGSITSTVQVNQDAGFSIVQYTGTGTAATIGHGLGVAPAMYIVKNRDQVGTNWTVFHKDLTSNAYSLYLNDSSAQSNAVGYWNGTSPTSTVFSIKNTSGDVNTNTEDYVVYCFADVQGYSKFGKYVGNGSTNGTFVYTGFKPAFVMTKNTSATDSWVIMDEKRSPSNVANKYLLPNTSGAEGTNFDMFDFVSNGFKCRRATSQNASGNTFIYMAFAENPFVTSTGIPTTAR